VSPRQKRLKKVVDLREQELDRRVAKLSDSRAAEARALSSEEQKKRELEQASETRLSLLSDPELSAKSWIEANEWLSGRRVGHEKARVELARAQLATRSAQNEVVAARADLKKLELLSARIEQQEQGQARKLERRMEDELAALRFRNSGGQDDSR
jgi:flagellar export protein FliJ